jgi:hypothetical protein
VTMSSGRPPAVRAGVTWGTGSSLLIVTSPQPKG